MSLLLDALRKAEQERRLGQPPSALDPPAPVSAAPRERSPRVLVRVGLLAGVVAVLAWALSGGPRPPKPGTSVVPPETAAVPARPAPAPSAPPLLEAESLAEVEPLESLADLPLAPPPPAPRRAEPAAEPERVIAEVPAGEQALRVVEAQAPVLTPQAPTSEVGPAPPGLPRIADLPPQIRQAFPEPRLEVHVYNDDPQRRFVLMDGQRYREGDRVGDGARVARILPDGVVLEASGVEALLPRP
jgi:general secretion pathway protein B